MVGPAHRRPHDLVGRQQQPKPAPQPGREAYGDGTEDAGAGQPGPLRWDDRRRRWAGRAERGQHRDGGGRGGSAVRPVPGPEPAAARLGAVLCHAPESITAALARRVSRLGSPWESPRCGLPRIELGWRGPPFSNRSHGGAAVPRCSTGRRRAASETVRWRTRGSLAGLPASLLWPTSLGPPCFPGASAARRGIRAVAKARRQEFRSDDEVR